MIVRNNILSTTLKIQIYEKIIILTLTALIFSININAQTTPTYEEQIKYIFATLDK